MFTACRRDFSSVLRDCRASDKHLGRPAAHGRAAVAQRAVLSADSKLVAVQAMEQRYTALAEELGRLAAENQRLTSEHAQLAKVWNL